MLRKTLYTMLFIIIFTTLGLVMNWTINYVSQPILSSESGTFSFTQGGIEQIGLWMSASVEHKKPILFGLMMIPAQAIQIYRFFIGLYAVLFAVYLYIISKSNIPYREKNNMEVEDGEETISMELNDSASIHSGSSGTYW